MVERECFRKMYLNLSDPGIMLIELFAWLSEAMLYRINRVPEAGLVRLLVLLGARFATAQPLLATVQFTPLQLDKSCQLPPGKLLQARSQVNESGVIFETLQSLKFKPEIDAEVHLSAYAHSPDTAGV